MKTTLNIERPLSSRVVSLYRSSCRNVGDWHSAPVRYFPLLNGRIINILSVKKSVILIDADVIVGGGGMFTPKNNDRFKFIHLAPGRRLVGWGVGENRHFKKDWIKGQPFKLPDWAYRCDLLGVRDWGTSMRWVPCVSCLHPDFENPKPPIHDIVVYEHMDHPIDIVGFPKRSNKGKDIKTTLAFLASGRVVITSSYHGAFWATLLGRSVVAFPFSTKFYGMRHRPVLSRPADWKKAVEMAVMYPQAFAECRKATLSFAMDVFKLLK